MSFKQIVIWGYKPPMKHTHHSIHYGYYKAFKEMGYETLWLDNDSDISNINFDNSLFFTEHQVDDKLPHNKNSKYILHNCAGEDYADILPENKVSIQFFHKDVLGYETTKVNSYTYVGKDIIYQPWATDLLPREINIDEARNEKTNKECLWIGSYSPEDRSEFENNTELDPFFNECKDNGIRIKHIDPWYRPVSFEENRRLVNQAYLAPAINGAFQKRTYYVPCRIFKNISFGSLGITNNEFVNNMFDGRLIYSSDTKELFHKSIEKKNDPNVLNEIKDLMNEVKEKHTFINRAQVLLDFWGVK